MCCAIQGADSHPIHFTFADLANRLPVQTSNVNGQIEAWSPPPPALNMWMMFACSVMYLVLAWYFGQVRYGGCEVAIVVVVVVVDAM